MAVLLALVGVLVVEALLAARGPREAFTGPPRAPRAFGERGTRITYVVLGDSTGAGQGAPYARGIAVQTARHLAGARRVTLVNLSVSGAHAAGVARDQAARAAALRPHVALVAVGANDVTGLTSRRALRRALRSTLATLRRTRCDVRVVLTGAPDVGAPPRLAQPLRAVAGLRTGQLNDTLDDLAAETGVLRAPVAEQTGPAFRSDPGLFAADRFHPNARGYATWTPVLTRALDRATAAPRRRCPTR